MDAQADERRRNGKRSRRKGAREELSVLRVLQDAGFAAEKISRAYCSSADISVPLLGRDRLVEVKLRSGDAFATFYKWLEQRDILVVRADRKEPLAIVPLRFAVEIASKAEENR